ncbi:uncharacterized protein BP01DRAFT_187909 [Aspergillus saccharolyticus JOP 1030-1]|uniref:Uncharacterized protein n=1 Tax=Aspergillus saccharolyticus JOP 1030-1 TaxID=1450539 RepID=A0A318Z2A1_9EURO|nr:hypothetical protein BP01DRAFT_187909 [Aspergillus saccharolyticus JOP 1030-1]PYH41069.1 hypothetical protein BP01DRAFT_187909 [Aspergillus saccharolyticus JOP 1030-1]
MMHSLPRKYSVLYQLIRISFGAKEHRPPPRGLPAPIPANGTKLGLTTLGRGTILVYCMTMGPGAMGWMNFPLVHGWLWREFKSSL